MTEERKRHFRALIAGRLPFDWASSIGPVKKKMGQIHTIANAFKNAFKTRPGLASAASESMSSDIKPKPHSPSISGPSSLGSLPLTEDGQEKNTTRPMGNSLSGANEADLATCFAGLRPREEEVGNGADVCFRLMFEECAFPDAYVDLQAIQLPSDKELIKAEKFQELVKAVQEIQEKAAKIAKLVETPRVTFRVKVKKSSLHKYIQPHITLLFAAVLSEEPQQPAPLLLENLKHFQQEDLPILDPHQTLHSLVKIGIYKRKLNFEALSRNQRSSPIREPTTETNVPNAAREDSTEKEESQIMCTLTIRTACLAIALSWALQKFHFPSLKVSKIFLEAIDSSFAEENSSEVGTDSPKERKLIKYYEKHLGMSLEPNSDYEMVGDLPTTMKNCNRCQMVKHLKPIESRRK